MDSAEVQRRLYEAIQQSNIQENLAQALEYTPEVFTSVTMLYVPCIVHGVPVRAFIDSGAQVSIMNEATAERCGLMRLLDRRMRGVAHGVGTQRIVGRIHMTMVNLAGLHLPFSFCVLEGQQIDLIIGLDQMRRHQMRIDLRENCLSMGDVSVSFLPESELPDYAKPGYVRSREEDGEEESSKTQVPRDDKSGGGVCGGVVTTSSNTVSDNSLHATATSPPIARKVMDGGRSRRRLH